MAAARTRNRVRWLVAVVAAMATTAARAEPPAACFAPQSLPARPGEREPQKHVHTFDRSDAPQSLAAFAPLPAGLRGAIRRVDLPKGSRKLVALTFDLCEQFGEISGYDGPIFDYLRANHIKATLFVGGKWMRSHDERTRQLVADPLFEIGNHGWAHRNLRLLQGAALSQEIEGPQRAYEAVRGRLAAEQCLPAKPAPTRLSLFRFPYGACNQASLDAVNDAGLLAIQWDLSTGDPSPAEGAQAIANAMLHQARPGSIIIAHANGRGYHTAAALPLALPKLKAAGYEFVTVSELLAAGTPVVEPRCYDSRPGDTDRYDHPLALHAAKTGPGKGAAGASAQGEVLPWATGHRSAGARSAGSAPPPPPAPQDKPWWQKLWQ